MRRDPLDFNWSNLLIKACPLCTADLYQKPAGYECGLKSSLIPKANAALSCDFFITTERFNEVVKNVRAGSKRRRIHRR